MLNNQGLIIHFDEAIRSALIRENGELPLSFSDALSVADFEIGQIQIALLSFDGEHIDYICLASKGRKVVTRKSRIEFFDIVKLPSIATKQIEGVFDTNLKGHFIRSSSGSGGRVPTKTWKRLIEILKELCPGQRAEIERLVSIQLVSRYRLSGENTEILLQERDALGGALDIFSGNNELRKEVLSSWAPDESEISNRDEKQLTAILTRSERSQKSFLSGISARYIQEESALQHDLYNWEDIQANTHEFGVSRFEKGSRRLEVVYANKNDLEKTLGVDLIYYNKSYHAFVLVQYKIMKEESRESGFVYRPDNQLKKELRRMNAFNKLYSRATPIENDNQYRINSDGFLFKLVPNKGFQVANDKLVPGMYLSREYMNFLLGKNGPKGPKGGSILGFKHSPRYLTNTEFSSAVNRGWLGSNSDQSDVLEIIVSKFLQAGRAVLIAVEDAQAA